MPIRKIIKKNTTKGIKKPKKMDTSKKKIIRELPAEKRKSIWERLLP